VAFDWWKNSLFHPNRLLLATRFLEFSISESSWTDIHHHLHVKAESGVITVMLRFIFIHAFWKALYFLLTDNLIGVESVAPCPCAVNLVLIGIVHCTKVPAAFATCWVWATSSSKKWTPDSLIMFCLGFPLGEMFFSSSFLLKMAILQKEGSECFMDLGRWRFFYHIDLHIFERATHTFIGDIIIGLASSQLD